MIEKDFDKKDLYEKLEKFKGIMGRLAKADKLVPAQIQSDERLLNAHITLKVQAQSLAFYIKERFIDTVFRDAGFLQYELARAYYIESKEYNYNHDLYDLSVKHGSLDYFKQYVSNSLEGVKKHYKNDVKLDTDFINQFLGAF